MEGIISNFRKSMHRQTPSHPIILISGVDSKEKAAKFVGKKAVWTSPAGKQLKGEIRAPHGNKGAVRAIFETGLPGQSIGTKVVIQ
ncbi:50S ribosomal protein L35Ae [sediment metagenome]|uniref:50S ribosomal protein L35Ae n=1 Tax=sediment metagenome TaxID=749907 RepID=D9PEX7_9ZZZZ